MRALLVAVILGLTAAGAAAQTPAEADPAQAQEPIVRTIIRDALGDLGVSVNGAQSGGRQLQQCLGDCCCVAAGVRSCDQRDDCRARGGRCVAAPDGC